MIQEGPLSDSERRTAKYLWRLGAGGLTVSATILLARQMIKSSNDDEWPGSGTSAGGSTSTGVPSSSTEGVSEFISIDNVLALAVLLSAVSMATAYIRNNNSDHAVV